MSISCSATSRACCQHYSTWPLRATRKRRQLSTVRGWAAALGAPHPLGQLRIQVHHGRLILERTADILLALRAAASADEDAARLWQINRTQRRTVQEHLMVGIVEKAPTVDLETAVNVALTLLSPETYTDLVVGAGWTGQQYEEWVVNTLAATLGLDRTVKSRK